MTIYEYTYTRRKVSESPAKIGAPEDTLPILADLFDGVESEQFVVLTLNSKNQIIGTETLYKGNVAGASVRVGEVFRGAIRQNAACILVAHNHPSGDPSPSAEDLKITSEIAKAGTLLDIELLDHIVVGEVGRFQSLRALGALA